MSGIVLSSVVLRSQNMEDTRLFYQCLFGVEFKEEQHENGPKHYSCLLGEFLLEIYPQPTDERGTDQLGFIVDFLLGYHTPQFYCGLQFQARSKNPN